MVNKVSQPFTSDFLDLLPYIENMCVLTKTSTPQPGQKVAPIGYKDERRETAPGHLLTNEESLWIRLEQVSHFIQFVQSHEYHNKSSPYRTLIRP
jgi:hypothetical protein